MLRINDLFFRSDNGVHILKKYNPGKHGMRKPGFLRFLMVLAEISGGVEKFLRADGSFDPHRLAAKENWLARRAFNFRPALQGILQRHPRGIQAAVAIGKKP